MNLLKILLTTMILFGCTQRGQQSNPISNQYVTIIQAGDSVWYYCGVTDTASMCHILAIPRQDSTLTPLGYVQYRVYYQDWMTGKVTDSVWSSVNAIDFYEQDSLLIFEFSTHVRPNYRYRLPFMKQ